MDTLQMLRFFRFCSIILSLTIIINSCKDEINTDGITHINLERAINSPISKGPIKSHLVYNNILETDLGDELFRNLYVKAHSEKRLYLTDYSKILIINIESGAVENIVNSRGRGPGEYMFPSSIVTTDSSVVLTDVVQRRINEYVTDMSICKKTIPTNNVAAVVPIDKENWAVSYINTPGRKSSLSIYSKDGKLVRESVIKNNYIESPNIRTDYLAKYKSNVYYMPAYSDTLYIVDSSIDKPEYVFHRGKYKMPMENYASLDVFHEHFNDYIQNLDYVISDDIIYVTYNYDSNVYYDIYRNDGVLLYHYKVPNESSNKGFPYTLNGTTLYLWPKYAVDNRLYCVLDSNMAQRLLPDYEDNNKLVIIILEHIMC